MSLTFITALLARANITINVCGTELTGFSSPQR
jgi:hypothetical protein